MRQLQTLVSYKGKGTDANCANTDTAFVVAVVVLSTAYFVTTSLLYGLVLSVNAKRKRSSTITALLTAVPPVVVLVLGPLRDATTTESLHNAILAFEANQTTLPPLANWNCSAVLFFRFAVIPLTFLPMIMRLLRLAHRAREQHIAMETHLQDVVKIDRAVGVDEDGYSSKAFLNGPFAPKQNEFQGGGASASATSKRSSTSDALPSTNHAAAGDSSGQSTPERPKLDVVIKSFVPDKPIAEADSFESHMTYESVNRTTLFLALAAWAPTLIPPLVMIGTLPLFNPATGCPTSPLVACELGTVPNAVMFVLYAGFFTALAFATYQLPKETLHIRRNLVLGMTCGALLVFPALGLMAAEGTGAVQIPFTLDWLVFAGLSLAHVMVVSGALASAATRLLCGAPPPPAVTEAASHLSDLLRDVEFNRAFAAHLDLEYAGENIRFINEVRLFRDNYDRVDATKRVWWARKIYLSFLPLTAKSQINVSNQLREEMASVFAVHDLGKTLTPKVFDKVEGEVLGMLRGSFLVFARTNGDVVRAALKRRGTPASANRAPGAAATKSTKAADKSSYLSSPASSPAAAGAYGSLVAPSTASSPSPNASPAPPGPLA